MIKVNLQPKVLIDAGEGFKMPLWPLILLTIVMAAGVLGVMYVTSDRISAAEAEIRDLDFKLRDFQKTLDAFDQAKAEKDYLQGKRDFVHSISSNQKQWVDFFDEIRAKMPKDVWLTKFEGERSGSYTLEGQTFSYSSIGFFMLQFNSIPYVTTVALDQASAKKSGSSSGDVAAFAKSFKITGDMKLSAKDAEPEEEKKGAAAAKTAARRGAKDDPKNKKNKDELSPEDL
ncbi:MAG TPA: PilN domain-containing protein [bacterium]|nr:PilN domain-containing protein [bacterium]